MRWTKGQALTFNIVVTVVFLALLGMFAYTAEAGSVPPPSDIKELRLEPIPNPEATLAEVPDRVQELFNAPKYKQCQIRANMVIEGAKMRVAGITIKDYIINLNGWMKEQAALSMLKWRSMNDNEVAFLSSHWEVGYYSMDAWIKARDPKAKITLQQYKYAAQGMGAEWNGACMVGRFDQDF